MTAAFDVERVRRDFPILAKTARGKPLAYLDNAATAQKPEVVIEAGVNYYRSANSNVHRGVYALAEEAEAAYVQARASAARHLNASAEEIIFTRGTTEALNLVAHSHGQANLREGDVVILTVMEHHANVVPWQFAAERTGAEIKVAPILPDGSLDRDALRSLLDLPNAKILSLAFASNSLGTVNPVAEICAEAKERGIATVVDGAQAAPHGPVDVQTIDCDFYALSGHKAYGPMGIGVLYGRRERLQAMPPYQGGGDMIDHVTFAKTTYAPSPQRFEAGTPNVAGAIGLGAALDYLASLDLTAADAHEQRLLRLATEGLADLPGLTLHGQAAEKAPLVSFTVEGIHPHDLASLLDAQGIAIRTGHHCCQPLMEHLGVTATARASFAFYNTEEEALRLVETTRKALSILR